MTSFVQESCERVDVLPLVSHANLIPAPKPLTQDLLAYFARPRQISSGAIPTTKSNFFNAFPTAQIIVANWFPNGFNRLLGTFGFRATIVYTLQVNATPFHTGLLAMSAQYGVKGPTRLNIACVQRFAPTVTIVD